MLTLQEARERVVAAASGPVPDEDVPVARARGRVLSAEVRAAGEIPGWANSAMDGFAVAAGPAGRRLPLAGEARAGAPSPVPVAPGTAMRISTGAALPEGADAVVRLEDAEEADGAVLLRVATEPRANVREPGEDLHAGALVLAAGTELGGAELAAAVTAGAATVRVGVRPRVAVVATGDELREPGAALAPGELHDSNRIALAALAEGAGAEVVSASGAGDDAAATRDALAAALDAADVVLVSGGVSVGPHDHVRPALAALGVEEDFWRIALQPGKPTWLGRRGRTLVLGLPGNPVSAAVTGWLLARPALRVRQGAEPWPAALHAVLAAEVPRSRDRLRAVRVALGTGEDGTLRATPTGPQGSHIVTSLLGAGGLALVEPGEGPLAAGSVVPVERFAL